MTEGQHLQLSTITKEQSGSYECIASNDISSPDVRIVQVTVNCKRPKKIKNTDKVGGAGGIHVVGMKDLTFILNLTQVQVNTMPNLFGAPRYSSGKVPGCCYLLKLGFFLFCFVFFASLSHPGMVEEEKASPAGLRGGQQRRLLSDLGQL